MPDRKVRRLPAVEDGPAVGIITESDIVRRFGELTAEGPDRVQSARRGGRIAGLHWTLSTSVAAMLSRLKKLLEPPAGSADPSDVRSRIELATAALLVEVMRSDGVAEEERAAVEAAIAQRFGMSSGEAKALVAEAEAEVREAVGYHPFTSLINRHFSIQEKEQVVELLWQIAWADASLSAHEQHVIRKVADLLHLSHAAYVGAKLRARDAAGK